jgi:hypothetical protein
LAYSIALPDAVLELADAVGLNGVAAIARGPVAGRQVVQHLRQLRGVQLLGDLRRGRDVGEQVLDALEAGLGRGGEAVEELDLVEHQREVCAEFRHGSLLLYVVGFLKRSASPFTAPRNNPMSPPTAT